MGGRFLRKYVEEFLINKFKIENRLDVIEEIKDDFILREDLNDIFKNIYDIERICGKIVFERVILKELIYLKNLIEKLFNLKDIINLLNVKILKEYVLEMDKLDDIYNLIDEVILEEFMIIIKDGNIIKLDFSDEFKELREIFKNGVFFVKEIENREREKIGVKLLKIGFNKVFGYYIEIIKVNFK